MTCLSWHRLRSNQVRLALSLLASELRNLWRRLALHNRIENWSMTSLEQRLVKTGTAGEACAVLLAAPRGGTPEPAAVRGDAAADTPGARRIVEAATEEKSVHKR